MEVILGNTIFEGSVSAGNDVWLIVAFLALFIFIAIVLLKRSRKLDDLLAE
ncbi:hypothetical protein H6504_01715 [Candidatus Woesearchaeota archaeon]|nr:hypothetical protein [Candidatus Woesearchaeota archaeon]